MKWEDEEREEGGRKAEESRKEDDEKQWKCSENVGSSKKGVYVRVLFILSLRNIQILKHC